jgi:hypothetical protein
MEIITEEPIVIGEKLTVKFSSGRTGTIKIFDDYPTEIVVEGGEPTEEEKNEVSELIFGDS